jgi:uncharacterized lipoprotein YbaY/heat shock protein HslJ
MNRHGIVSVVVLVALSLALVGCDDRADVTGTATYRERLALPPDAVLEVVLEDVSRADALAVTVSRHVDEQPGQPPFSFSVAYDRGAIDPDRAYAVRARVTVGGQPFFTTDQVYPVLTRGYGSHVDLLLVASRGTETAVQEGPVPLSGMVRYLADAAIFTDCATRRRLPVAMVGDYVALERAYLEARPEPGAELLASFWGRIVDRPAMEGEGGAASVVVEQFEGVWPGETCGNPGMTESLEDTYWKLTRLGALPVRVHPDFREPHLVLRSAEGRVAGSSGCNGVGGAYELDGDALRFGEFMSTMMACPGIMEQERAMVQALGRVARWRIEGQHLDLLDEGGDRLMRLEARAFP